MITQSLDAISKQRAVLEKEYEKTLKKNFPKGSDSYMEIIDNCHTVLAERKIKSVSMRGISYVRDPSLSESEIPVIITGTAVAARIINRDTGFSLYMDLDGKHECVTELTRAYVNSIGIKGGV